MVHARARKEIRKRALLISQQSNEIVLKQTVNFLFCFGDVPTKALSMRRFLGYHNHAGWSSLVARWAHNPKVAGSNPAPATNAIMSLAGFGEYEQNPKKTLFKVSF
jgi:hypothetical protein